MKKVNNFETDNESLDMYDARLLSTMYKRIAIIILIGAVLMLCSCKKENDLGPEPNINLTDWANFGNTTFGVDTSLYGVYVLTDSNSVSTDAKIKR